MAWIANIRGNYYLYKSIKVNGRWTTKVIERFGKERPKFYLPIVLRGYCEDILKNLPEKSVDLIIDDPPYGITHSSWDIEPDWNILAELYERVLKDNGLIYIFGRQPSLFSIYNTFKNHFSFRYEIIWEKDKNPWVSNYMPIPIHENIFAFNKKNCPASETKFYPERVGEIGKPYKKIRNSTDKPKYQGKFNDNFIKINNGQRYPKTVLKFNTVHGRSQEYCGFSSQKPLSLISWIILSSSDKGDIILDPHVGSGSTCISAFNLYRKSVGMELNSESILLLKSRFNKVLSKRPKTIIDEEWISLKGFEGNGGNVIF